MAKSSRSKSKLRAKSIKRKGEFSKHVSERNSRIAKKLDEETRRQEEKEGSDAIAEDTVMEVEEDKVEKKISTSGWRDSHKQKYKRNKMKKNRTMRH